MVDLSASSIAALCGACSLAKSHHTATASYRKTVIRSSPAKLLFIKNENKHLSGYEVIPLEMDRSGTKFLGYPLGKDKETGELITISAGDFKGIRLADDSDEGTMMLRVIKNGHLKYVTSVWHLRTKELPQGKKYVWHVTDKDVSDAVRIEP